MTGSEESRKFATPAPLYAVSIHNATCSGQLERMREMAKQAEEWLRASGDVSAALEILNAIMQRRKLPCIPSLRVPSPRIYSWKRSYIYVWGFPIGEAKSGVDVPPALLPWAKFS